MLKLDAGHGCERSLLLRMVPRSHGPERLGRRRVLHELSCLASLLRTEGPRPPSALSANPAAGLAGNQRGPPKGRLSRPFSLRAWRWASASAWRAIIRLALSSSLSEHPKEESTSSSLADLLSSGAGKSSWAVGERLCGTPPQCMRSRRRIDRRPDLQ